jgi:hypothetical protein
MTVRVLACKMVVAVVVAAAVVGMVKIKLVVLGLLGGRWCR